MTDRSLGPFGQKLRQLRLRAGLTQEELAERAGLSPRSASDLERGVNRLPRRDTAKSLGDALRLADADRVGFEMAARGRTEAAVQTHDLLPTGGRLPVSLPPRPALPKGEMPVGEAAKRPAASQARSRPLRIAVGQLMWSSGTPA
jgi:transcriptional regulator with XRE-family HTH domain